MGLLDKFGKKDKSAPAKKTATKAKKADKPEEKAAPAAETAAPAAKAVRGPLAKEDAGESYRILIRPILTEKTSMQQAMGQYTFAVASGATKVDVARAVRDLYGVKPAQVRIVNAQGKMVRFGRSQGREKTVKKAIVSLKSGETISVLE
ncbi:MAG TPA: 50S ribosomal protein L23 [Candidatus Eisenbacteria bacterium]|jgi:large subunit ribosomal protein L23|nr:50S ribosomal protein L23 [Candidatus Eisenbacteria bacterium]